MRLFRRAAPFLLTLALTACRSDSEKLAESRQNLESWTATLRFARAKSAELPEPFKKVLFETATKEVRKELQQLEKEAAKSASPEASSLAGRARGLLSEIQGLQSGSERPGGS
jgi:hypothetical protein